MTDPPLDDENGGGADQRIRQLRKANLGGQVDVDDIIAQLESQEARILTKLRKRGIEKKSRQRQEEGRGEVAPLLPLAEPDEATAGPDEELLALLVGQMGSKLEAKLICKVEEEMRNIAKVQEDTKKKSAQQQQMQQKGDDEHEKHLTQDTFSFLIVTPVFSRPFLLALAVAALQLAIFCLAAVNLLDFENNPDNPMGIPANVEPSVRATQFLLLILAVVSAADLLVLIDIMRNGCSAVLNRTFEHASSSKFAFYAVLRAVQGLISLVIIFILIVNSNAILDMLMNFAAFEFVSQLDETFFSLTEQGFLGKHCQEAALLVIETPYISKEHRYQQLRKMLAACVFLVGLVCGWVVVVVKQVNGDYVCSTLLVQLGDDTIPQLGTFSGFYDLTTHTGTQRTQYVERRSNGRAKFAYCQSIGAWTFVWQDNPATELNPCKWKARSEKTDVFDLTETASLTWYVQDDNGREIVLEPFYLACYDCLSDESYDCKGRGRCLDGVCSCDDGWFGVRCELIQPCSNLAVDIRYGSFPALRGWSQDLDVLVDEKRTR